MNKYPTLTLLDFEGAVLTALQLPNKTFIIIDQYKEVVDFFNVTDFVGFIFRGKVVRDSKGKFWNYSKEHNDAKPSNEQLLKFIGL